MNASTMSSSKLIIALEANKESRGTSGSGKAHPEPEFQHSPSFRKSQVFVDCNPTSYLWVLGTPTSLRIFASYKFLMRNIKFSPAILRSGSSSLSILQ